MTVCTHQKTLCILGIFVHLLYIFEVLEPRFEEVITTTQHQGASYKK